MRLVAVQFQFTKFSFSSSPLLIWLSSFNISSYSTCSPHQMFVPAGEVEHDFKSLRKLAANYMLQHESHFKNFLSLAKETFQVFSSLGGAMILFL
jgi:hypothetical protein